MKAIVQDEYGLPDDVLELKEIDKPVVKDDEVLVRVHAAAVHVSDWVFVRGVPYITRPMIGLLRPKNSVPGKDIAGKVEAVGKKVKQLRPGDEVFGWCKGALAEYACAGEDNFVPKPANLRARGLDQRCVGRRGAVRRADRQGVRRGRDRRVQHEERGHGPVNRRRPGHRLYPGGLDQEQAALRLYPR
jgi:hypothetical protein